VSHTNERVVHSARLGLGKPEISYDLTSAELMLRDGNKAETIGLKDITKLHFSTYIADALVDQSDIHGRLSIHARNRKPIVMPSHHFQGVGDYMDRGETYRAFIKELAQTISANNLRIKVTTGSQIWRYLYLAALIVLSVLMFLVLLGLVFGDGGGSLLTGIVLLATGLAGAWYGYRSSKPQDLDLNNLPDHLISLN